MVRNHTAIVTRQYSTDHAAFLHKVPRLTPPSPKVQPVRSISAAPALYSSIHSSLDEAEVPAHATSSTVTASGGVSVAVNVAVGGAVAVALGVGEGQPLAPVVGDNNVLGHG